MCEMLTYVIFVALEKKCRIDVHAAIKMSGHYASDMIE